MPQIPRSWLESHQSRMDKQRSRFDILFKFVVAGIVFSFLLLLVWYGILAFMSVSFFKSVDMSKGIKPVIEKAWCGQEGCMDKK